jgi:hypothetical protein
MFERVAQIGKGHTTPLHRVPGVIVHEDSAAARQRTNSAPSVRSLHHFSREGSRHFVKSSPYVYNFLDKIWTRAAATGLRKPKQTTAKGPQQKENFA